MPGESWLPHGLGICRDAEKRWGFCFIFSCICCLHTTFPGPLPEAPGVFLHLVLGHARLLLSSAWALWVIRVSPACSRRVFERRIMGIQGRSEGVPGSICFCFHSCCAVENFTLPPREVWFGAQSENCQALGMPNSSIMFT